MAPITRRSSGGGSRSSNSATALAHRTHRAIAELSAKRTLADVDRQRGDTVAEHLVDPSVERLDAAHVELSVDAHGRVPVSVDDHIKADQLLGLPL